MEKKYINESRYKKSSTRKRRDINNIKNKTKQVPKLEKSKNTKKIKSKVKRNKKNNNSKTKNIIICILLLLLIGIISRAILKEENEPFIPIYFGNESNDEEIIIGVITNDSLLDENTSNVVLQELNNYTKNMLITVNQDYTINYCLADSIEKISNKEYNLKIKDKIEANDIKKSIEEYFKNTNSIYYSKLNNIDSLSVTNNNTIKIYLKNDDPYFVYNLNIPINLNESIANYELDNKSNSNKLIYNRAKKASSSLPVRLIVKKYKDMYKAVEAYKKGEINVFVTNAENTENIIGKYEYNISTFRNGETAFLFLNNKSKLLAKEEIRKAIAYSIDRDKIIKDIISSKADKIDLPYIYDEARYSYDIYAAENILLTSGYKKINGLYVKTDDGTQSILNLIVNKDDKININIANRIKKNLSAMGIGINLEKLSQNAIKKRLKSNDYDMIIAKVNLNDNPDISFIKNKLFTTASINEKINNINNSSVMELANNIKSLQNELSDNISIIGLYASTSYVIYSKNIIGLENLSYLKIFENVFN